MARQDVLNALSFYDSSTNSWTYPPSHAPGDVATADIAIFTDAIMKLYDDSPTARGYLETLAATGAIRISASTQFGPAAVRPVELSPGVWTVPYLNFPSSAPEIYGMTSFGEIFQFSLETLIGHELSHLMGNNDPSGTTNSIMNNPNFDYVGDTVRDEWSISLELGESNQRTNYAAAFTTNSSRGAFLDLNGDYVPDGGFVEIIRFGDLLGQSVDDVIDLSTRTDGRSALIFGMTGDDIIDATGEADYVYGGDGSDIIFGHEGDDYLWGENGDDVVYGGDGSDRIYAGNGDDTLEGGAGADFIDGGDGSDILVGGHGADELHGGDGNDLLRSGDETTAEYLPQFLYGGAGNDIIIAETGTTVVAEGGAGNDIFWIGDSLGMVTNGQLNTGIVIFDPEAGDRLYWNGYELNGGATVLLDFEISGGVPFYNFAAVDTNGVIYIKHTGYISIILPDTSGAVIYGFQNGDLGITFDSAYDTANIQFDYDEEGNIVDWETNVPLSNIVLDDVYGNYEDLSGAMYAIANPGPNLEPVIPLI